MSKHDANDDSGLESLFSGLESLVNGQHCNCGGCEECGDGATVDELESDWSSAAEIPDLTVNLPRTGTDVDEILSLGLDDAIHGVDRFVRNVDHFELSPLFNAFEQAAGFEMPRAFEQPFAADLGSNSATATGPHMGGPAPVPTLDVKGDDTGAGAGAFAGSTAGGTGIPDGMQGSAPGPYVQPSTDPSAIDRIGAGLSGVLNNVLGGLRGSNLNQNTGVHPAAPIPHGTMGPVYAPEPDYGTANVPVRVRGTQIDLEPNPTQWFGKHPLLSLAMVFLGLYLLIFVVILAKK
jgi:hypothetical protein